MSITTGTPYGYSLTPEELAREASDKAAIGWSAWEIERAVYGIAS